MVAATRRSARAGAIFDRGVGLREKKRLVRDQGRPASREEGDLRPWPLCSSTKRSRWFARANVIACVRVRGGRFTEQTDRVRIKCVLHF